MIKKRNMGLGDTITPWRVSSNQEGNYKTNVPVNATLIGTAATALSSIFMIFRSLYGESDTIMDIMITVWFVASVIQIPLVLAFTMKHQKKKSKINPVVPKTLQFHEDEHDFDDISNEGNEMITFPIHQAKGELGQAPVPTPTLETNKETNEVTTDNDGLPKIIMTHVEVYDHVESIDDAAEDSVKAAENCDTGDNSENIEFAVSNEQIKLTEMGEASGQLPGEVCHM